MSDGALLSRHYFLSQGASWTMTADLAGRVALVTGASRLIGIGAAVARAFAGAGADVAFSHWTAYDRESYGTDTSEPDQLAAELRALGVRAEPIEADLSDPTTPARLFDRVEEQLGPVSILVNNAAVSLHDDLETITAKSLDAHYAVNVRATALLSGEFARRFTDSGDHAGRIINMTSGQSVGAMPDELSYATTKGAIEALTVSSAPAAARKGITVNAVDPGATDTGWMTDELKAAIAAEMAFGRVGLPEDAARLILFLASDAGAWISGQVLHSRGA
jgi:3-oxoacyl-[acyl-carrier protein] reductase